jgi:hypothetical protein
MEDSTNYMTQTENFIAQHRFQPVLNDYVRSNNVTSNKGLVRRLFQPEAQRPVFLVINGISNSPTHAQWQLLVNSGGYGTNDFSRQITEWRSAIDSVKAPPPRIAQPVVAGGNVQFTVPGQRGQTNRVEASSDLRVWSTVTNLIGTNATITIRDPFTPPPRRFYRVVRP